VLPKDTGQRRALQKAKSNLAFYDVAVVLRVWRSWALSELIDELSPPTQAEVPFGTVIEALAIQRCIAPDSKIEAARWYPKTALPELQGVRPSRFNNSRIHRVLQVLEQIEQPLQEHLARRIEAQQGPFACFFLDCTDTWFVGQGPDSARKAKTKEGLLRKRVGIVLLCDQRGFPLRWATVEGNHYEATTMTRTIEQVADLNWAQGVPFVADRIMGNGVTVETLLAQKIRLVTAVPAPQMPSYTPRIPLGVFDDVALTQNLAATNAALHRAALKAGFTKVSEQRYALDLGTFEKGEDGASDGSTPSPLAPSRALAALQVGHRVVADLDAGATLEQIAQRWECTAQCLRKWCALVALVPSIQEQIEAGKADRLTPEVLKAIAGKSPQEQQAAFDDACRCAGQGLPLRVNRTLAKLIEFVPVRVRAVVDFKPQMFIEQREAAIGNRDKFLGFVQQLNRQLRSAHSQKSRDSISATVENKLKRFEMSGLFSVELTTETIERRTVYQVKTTADQEAWHRRRRADGLTLIITQPDLVISAQQVVELYFAKDKVEKDFQLIKSVVKLRPLRHRTDPKVRAHVSLCMLALLLERTLEERMANAGLPMTAERLLCTLEDAKLNLYPTEEGPLYSGTTPDPDQHNILAALGLLDLADDDAVASLVTPR